MNQTIQKTTRVLAGNRIELVTPELAEGTAVQVTITAPEVQLSSQTSSAPAGEQSLADFLRSLPPSKRTVEEWEEFDREFQRGRDEWDR